MLYKVEDVPFEHIHPYPEGANYCPICGVSISKRQVIFGQIVEDVDIVETRSNYFVGKIIGLVDRYDQIDVISSKDSLEGVIKDLQSRNLYNDSFGIYLVLVEE